MSPKKNTLLESETKAPYTKSARARKLTTRRLRLRVARDSAEPGYHYPARLECVQKGQVLSLPALVAESGEICVALALPLVPSGGILRGVLVAGKERLEVRLQEFSSGYAENELLVCQRFLKL